MTEEEKEAIKDLIDSSYESLLDGTTITSNKAINTILNLIEKLQKELKQKDKIIDLMAETINNHDIDEDICKQMGQKANCNEFEDTEKCKECIKQYFINKAKEIR